MSDGINDDVLRNRLYDAAIDDTNRVGCGGNIAIDRNDLLALIELYDTAFDEVEDAWLARHRHDVEEKRLHHARDIKNAIESGLDTRRA